MLKWITDRQIKSCHRFIGSLKEILMYQIKAITDSSITGLTEHKPRNYLDAVVTEGFFGFCYYHIVRVAMEFEFLATATIDVRAYIFSFITGKVLEKLAHLVDWCFWKCVGTREEYESAKDPSFIKTLIWTVVDFVQGVDEVIDLIYSSIFQIRTLEELKKLETSVTLKKVELRPEELKTSREEPYEDLLENGQLRRWIFADEELKIASVNKDLFSVKYALSQNEIVEVKPDMPDEPFFVSCVEGVKRKWVLREEKVRRPLAIREMAVMEVVRKVFRDEVFSHSLYVATWEIARHIAELIFKVQVITFFPISILSHVILFVTKQIQALEAHYKRTWKEKELDFKGVFDLSIKDESPEFTMMMLLEQQFVALEKFLARRQIDPKFEKSFKMLWLRISNQTFNQETDFDTIQLGCIERLVLFKLFLAEIRERIAEFKSKWVDYKDDAVDVTISEMEEQLKDYSDKILKIELNWH